MGRRARSRALGEEDLSRDTRLSLRDGGRSQTARTPVALSTGFGRLTRCQTAGRHAPRAESGDPCPCRTRTARPAVLSTLRTVDTVRSEHPAPWATVALVTAQCRPVLWSAWAARTIAARSTRSGRMCRRAHSARPSAVASHADSSVSQPLRLVHMGSGASLASSAFSLTRTIHSRRAWRASARAEREHAYCSVISPSAKTTRCVPAPRTRLWGAAVRDANRRGPRAASETCPRWAL